MTNLEALNEIYKLLAIHNLAPEDCFKLVYDDLQRIPELEAKAKAFDVLKSKADFEIGCGAFEYEITMGDYVAPLTQEQYDILKKAGVE